MAKSISKQPAQQSLTDYSTSELVRLQQENSELKAEAAKNHRVAERLRLLANATNVLISGELNYETRLQNLTKAIVPYFADWCMIDIVAGDKSSYHVVTHSSPEKTKIAQRIQEKYPPKEDADYGIAEVIKKREARLYPTLSDELMRQTTQNEEHYNLIKQLGLVSVMLVPLISRDRALGGITFITAESGHRYNAEDFELAKQFAARAAVALDNALLHQEVEEAARNIEKFLAMLAHELRNPLTPIRTSLPILIAKGEEDYEIKDIAEIMDRQIKNMSRILDDLLDVARITEGKIQFRMETLNLLEVVNHEANIYRPELERKGFQFTVNLAKGPLYIRADRVRIEQVIANLLSNSSKYTPPGGKIFLECLPENGQVIIRIRDTGKGIPRDMLRKIFHLFTQADQSLDRSEGGLGLGLALVDMLVKHHKGSVTAVSEGPGKGSEFIVRLPLLENAPREEKNESAPAFSEDLPRRILVVDDNEDAANSISKLLRKLGHDVRTAYDGMTALEIASALKPEVVLLDLGLPLMDGYATASELRKKFTGDKMLLIAVSGYGQDEDRRRTREAGFNFHLVKPFDTQELRRILNNWQP